MKNPVKIFYFIFLAIFVLPQSAHAYLDPGTGSMIVQILVACFATVLVFFKSIWQGILQFFGKKPSIDKDEDDE